MIEEFDVNTMGPKGLCPDLNHSAYPYALAMLYGASFDFEKEKDVVNAQCPAPHGNVHFQVKRITLPKISENATGTALIANVTLSKDFRAILF